MKMTKDNGAIHVFLPSAKSAFGEILVKLREERGMTREQLAAKMKTLRPKFNPWLLQRWEEQGLAPDPYIFFPVLQRALNVKFIFNSK